MLRAAAVVRRSTLRLFSQFSRNSAGPIGVRCALRCLVNDLHQHLRLQTRRMPHPGPAGQARCLPDDWRLCNTSHATESGLQPLTTALSGHIRYRQLDFPS
jgi:hypothetical protein